MKLAFFLLGTALSLAAQPATHPLFDGDRVHEIALTFNQPDWFEQLTANFAENEDDVPYIEASFAWGDYQFARIGVRFKGNSSYRGATTRKKPFRIKFNEYVKGQKIEGIGSINLNNSWNDPSHVREKVHYELAALAGLRVPRMNYAALTINGQYWGLYFLGEIINDDFLASRYPAEDQGGNLYKSELPGTLAYLGPDAGPYRREFEKKTNEKADDWSDLIQLADVLREPKETLPGKLEPILDIDSVLRALALDNMLVNLDSYAGMGQNYYLYRRPSDNRFEFLMWDPSLSFGALAFGFNGDLKTLPLEFVTTVRGPGPGGQAPGPPPRPLATRLWENKDYKARYRQIYQELADTVVFPELVVARMKSLHTLVRPWIERDTQKLCTMEQFENSLTQDVQGTLPGPPPGGPGGPPPGGPPPGGGPGFRTPGLEPFVNGRVENVKRQLAQQ